jgi:hypothetical protein
MSHLAEGPSPPPQRQTAEAHLFVPLLQRFDEWVQAMPKSERSGLPLKKLRAVVEVATGILSWSKFAPEIEKGSRIFAKFASQDLKAHKGVILSAANRNDKRFFIDLGRCLSGEMDSRVYDKMDQHVALILACNPSIPAKDGVRVLEESGCPRITEDNFRVRKQRVKDALGELACISHHRKSD